jgi:hypothetical protein
MSDTVITTELREWIGRKTPLRPLEIISAADVRRYVDATGDANPLWLDDDFARDAGYRSRILPPTLVGWVPFSFKEGTERADSDPTDLRRQMPLPASTPTCATRARRPSGFSRLTWASNFRRRARLSTSSRVKAKPAWGSISARRNRC